MTPRLGWSLPTESKACACLALCGALTLYAPSHASVWACRKGLSCCKEGFGDGNIKDCSSKVQLREAERLLDMLSTLFPALATPEKRMPEKRALEKRTPARAPAVAPADVMRVPEAAALRERIRSLEGEKAEADALRKRICSLESENAEVSALRKRIRSLEGENAEAAARCTTLETRHVPKPTKCF